MLQLVLTRIADWQEGTVAIADPVGSTSPAAAWSCVVSSEAFPELALVTYGQSGDQAVAGAMLCLETRLADLFESLEFGGGQALHVVERRDASRGFVWLATPSPRDFANVSGLSECWVFAPEGPVIGHLSIVNAAGETRVVGAIRKRSVERRLAPHEAQMDVILALVDSLG